MTCFWLHHKLLYCMTNLLTSWCVFDVMANVLASWRVLDVMAYFMTSWRNLWRHDFLLTSWRSFWRHVMTSFLAHDVFSHLFLTSWRTFWRHDVSLTLWQIFWRYDELVDVMKCFDVFLVSWCVFDVMTNLKTHHDAKNTSKHFMTSTSSS